MKHSFGAGLLGLSLLGMLAIHPASAESLSLLGDRFRVEASWRTATGEGGEGTPVSLTSETGYFWFFSPTNIEVVVKVLDACADPSRRFWVFAGGLTDVEVTLVVTDNATGEKRTYRNPQGRPYQPIQDTNAFASCGASLCGQGSFDELAATPRADPDLEALARILDGGLTASTQVYQRVVNDVAAIRLRDPALTHVSFRPYLSPHTLFVTFDAATFSAVVAGSYRAWDCLNDWYGMSVAVSRPNEMVLDTSKTLDLQRVALDYRSLPGVTATEILTFDPFPILMPPPPDSFCARAQGDLYHYYIRNRSQQTTRLSYYTTLPGAAPVFVGAGPFTGPAPAWTQDAIACFGEHAAYL